MSSTSELSDIAYDILKVLGKDAYNREVYQRCGNRKQTRIGKDMADNQRRQKKTYAFA